MSTASILNNLFNGFGPTPAPAADPSPPWYFLPPEAQSPIVGKRLATGALGVNPQHALCRVTEAHARSLGKGVVVGVVDTGVERAHPDLSPAILSVFDATGEGVASIDPNGHGTHCCGIIAGRGRDQAPVGVAPEAMLRAAAGLGSGGSGRSDHLAAGIDRLVDEGVDVLSLSWGGPGVDQWARRAIDRAVARGVAVVAAAGNDGQRGSPPGDPGQYDKSFCVAAVDRFGVLAAFSTRGPFVDVAAPGVQVLSTYPGRRYASLSGTSMATPYVAGCVALTLAYLRAKMPGKTITGQNAQALLASLLVDLPPTGGDVGTGKGRPDMVAVFDAIDAATPTVPPPPADPVRRVWLDWSVVDGSLRLVQVPAT